MHSARVSLLADEDVQLAVVSALDLPKPENASIVDQAKALTLDTCFDQLKGPIAASLSLDGYAFKNICKEFGAKGALSGLKKKKCEALK